MYLIATFPSKKYNIDDYLAIKEYLLSIGYDRLKQTGEAGARKKTNNKWFEVQDSIGYWEEFFKPKIAYPNMTMFLPFFLDINKFFQNDKSFFITGKNIEFLTLFFNSSLFKYSFKDNFPKLGKAGFEVRKIFMEKIPVIKISDNINNRAKEIVASIQNLKTYNKCTKELEIEGDKLIFDLYDLTIEERKEIGFIDFQ